MDGKTVFVLYSDGCLDVNFGNLRGTPHLETLRDEVKAALESNLQLPIPSDYASKYPRYTHEQWLGKASELLAAWRGLLSKYQSS